jgi:hypothetical protein
MKSLKSATKLNFYVSNDRSRGVSSLGLAIKAGRCSSTSSTCCCCCGSTESPAEVGSA